MRLLWRSAGSLIALSISVSAMAQTDRLSLPLPSAPFAGTIAQRASDSISAPKRPVVAPQGAPNIFLMMSDDVGFGMSSTFGGPVPTPNFDRLAAAGQRYNRFHTTGICSPSRAALLTGRNHHVAGVGYLSDTPTGFPGYGGRIPDETATIAQILKLNGYNTAMFGKHHDVPPGEDGPNGPFDHWPTGLGFEYFYGYLGPESDQFRPNLIRGTDRVPDDNSMELLDARLASDAIRWLHTQTAANSGKPFFIYFAPSSAHEPHQAPGDFIARFRGKFDQGWDQIRVESWRRQLAMHILPADTKLSERPGEIPAWSSLSADEKAVAARSMEVAAAMLAYQDAQLGRVLDELDRMGLTDSTLIAFIIGDNGASADQGLEGAFNRNAGTNHIPESAAWRAAHLADFGGPSSYENYQAGWGWAMNAPLRWTKQYASMLGGIRNGMILSWRGHTPHPGTVCSEFGHLVDIAPTLLDAARLPMPNTVFGVKQKPLDGESLLPSLTNCMPEHPRTQYFEMGGKIGLWQNGWFLSGDDGRTPWEALPPAGPNPPISWSLYHLDRDFSQSIDVSATESARMEAMKARWTVEAERNQVFPLDHAFAGGRRMLVAPRPGHFTFWGNDVSMPIDVGPNFFGTSFEVNASIQLPSDHASGVLLADGSRFGGWSLYLDDGKPTFVYARPQETGSVTRIGATSSLSAGKHRVRLAFTSGGFGKPADVEILADDAPVASGRLDRTFVVFGGAGETLDSGRDTGVPVTEYRKPQGVFEGAIDRIDVEIKSPVHAAPNS